MQQELLSGKLVVPFAVQPLRVEGHGFVTLKSTAKLPKIQAFRDWLMAEVERGRRWQEAYLGSLPGRG